MIPTVEMPREVHEGRFICDYLTKNGFANFSYFGDNSPLLRNFARNPEFVLENGTDRDKRSRFGDGSFRAAARGLSPEEVTYAHQIGEIAREFVINMDHYALYDGRKMRAVDFQAGMYVPREGFTFLDALMAVFIKERRLL
jgi:hypothetical protein